MINTSAFERFLQPEELAASYSQVFVADLLHVLAAHACVPLQNHRSSTGPPSSVRSVKEPTVIPTVNLPVR